MRMLAGLFVGLLAVGAVSVFGADKEAPDVSQGRTKEKVPEDGP